jgi:hypothetical protein
MSSRTAPCPDPTPTAAPPTPASRCSKRSTAAQSWESSPWERRSLATESCDSGAIAIDRARLSTSWDFNQSATLRGYEQMFDAVTRPRRGNLGG